MSNFVKNGNNIFRVGNNIFAYTDEVFGDAEVFGVVAMSGSTNGENRLGIDSDNLYVCGTSSVSVFKLSNLSLPPTTIPISGALAVAVDEVANEVFISTSSNVIVLDRSTFVQKTTLAYGNRKYIAVDGTSRLFIGQTILDYNSKSVIGSLPLSNAGIAIDKDGGVIYLSDQSTLRSIYIIDYTSLSTIDVLDGPYLDASNVVGGLAVSKDKILYQVKQSGIKSISRSNPAGSGASKVYDNGASRPYGMVYDYRYNRLIFTLVATGSNQYLYLMPL